MTTLAHALSGSVVTLLYLKVPVTDYPSILIALTSASILDLDHLWLMWQKRAHFAKVGYKGQLHLARSYWHELSGVLIVGAGAVLLSFVNSRLAVLVFLPFLIHLAEDMLIGKFFPFAPFDKTQIELFSVPFKLKPVIDVIVLTISGGLWLAYLLVQ